MFFNCGFVYFNQVCGAPGSSAQRREQHLKQKNGMKKGNETRSHHDNDDATDGHHHEHPTHDEIGTKSHNETHAHDGKRNQKNKQHATRPTRKTNNGSSGRGGKSRHDRSINMETIKAKIAEKAKDIESIKAKIMEKAN